MDPQATWEAMIEEWQRGNWPTVIELAECLLHWLKKRGFPPETIPGQHMGGDWNRVAAISLCRFALARSRLVLNSPNHIPTEFPFTLTCDTCEGKGPGSYEAAVADNWRFIHYCPTEGLGNFLGRCPDCHGQVGDS